MCTSVCSRNDNSITHTKTRTPTHETCRSLKESLEEMVARHHGTLLSRTKTVTRLLFTSWTLLVGWCAAAWSNSKSIALDIGPCSVLGSNISDGAGVRVLLRIDRWRWSCFDCICAVCRKCLLLCTGLLIEFTAPVRTYWWRMNATTR